MQMNFIRTHLYPIIFSVCVLLHLAIWHVVWTDADRGILTIAFLDIGQGDAIYIESPNHHQILMDAGPDSSVLSELRKVMPWYDRSIDMMIITNPDKDHIAGFIPVLKRYEVGASMEPGTANDTDVNRAVHFAIDKEGVEKSIARRGQVIDLGGGVYLYILFPDRDVSALDSNTGSIIAKLVYGSTSVMLTGDAPKQTEEYIADLDSASIHSTILKEGHHGSRTSASEKFFTAVAPQYAVISAGLRNSYHHPHKETTDLLDTLHIPTLITFKEGTIVFTSDGKNFVRRK